MPKLRRRRRQNAVDRASQAAGSDAELGRRLGVQRQHVWNWRQSGRVPPEYAIRIERAVDGVVTRYDLRPDLYPRESAA